MRIVIEGPPQCGKTTVSTVVKERYGLCYVSASEAIRSAVQPGTYEGKSSEYSAMLRQLIDKNELIPDDLLVKVVSEATRRPDCVNGFVLDGFPRTKRQARLLTQDAHVSVDAVVELEMADTVLQTRFGGRWWHPASGRLYHTLYNPPKVAGKDDVTGEPLQQKPEDKPEVIMQRTFQYRRQAADMRGSFGSDRWLTVEANGSVEQVRQSVFDVLDALRRTTTPERTTASSQACDTKADLSGRATARRSWWQLW